MDSNCVNNYLGHALRAKCWHGLHIHVCQKRQTGKTWKSHCAQLIRRLQKDPTPQVPGMKKRFRRVMVGPERYIRCCTTLLGTILHWARDKSCCQREPTGKGRWEGRCNSYHLCSSWWRRGRVKSGQKGSKSLSEQGGSNWLEVFGGQPGSEGMMTKILRK